MKQNYFGKPISELCMEEEMLLRLAWNDYVERRNKELEEGLK
jgi:hypothetical protein|nr:MAG TPA: hypothetical protein [Caudoviricetes sp.]